MSSTTQKIDHKEFVRREKEVCESKKRFPGEIFAAQRVEYFNKKYKKFQYRYYQCNWCDGWHLATKR